MEVRPIDANALLRKRRNFGKDYALDPVDKNTDDQLIDLHHVLNAPTLDYAPVRHGEFEMQEEEYFAGLHVTPVLCKTCNTTYFTMNKEGKRAICCPYCGAMMPEPPKEEK